MIIFSINCKIFASASSEPSSNWRSFDRFNTCPFRLWSFNSLENVLKRKVSFIQASKYTRRLIFSDEMSIWPFDIQTLWISVKHLALTSLCSVIKLNANDNASQRFSECKGKMKNQIWVILYTYKYSPYTCWQSVPDVVVSCPANIKVSTSSKIPWRSISLTRLQKFMVIKHNL